MRKEKVIRKPSRKLKEGLKRGKASAGEIQPVPPKKGPWGGPAPGTLRDRGKKAPTTCQGGKKKIPPKGEKGGVGSPRPPVKNVGIRRQERGTIRSERSRRGKGECKGRGSWLCGGEKRRYQRRGPVRSPRKKKKKGNRAKSPAKKKERPFKTQLGRKGKKQEDRKEICSPKGFFNQAKNANRNRSTLGRSWDGPKVANCGRRCASKTTEG